MKEIIDMVAVSIEQYISCNFFSKYLNGRTKLLNVVNNAGFKRVTLVRLFKAKVTAIVFLLT